jgi:hypothetical protein
MVVVQLRSSRPFVKISISSLAMDFNQIKLNALDADKYLLNVKTPWINPFAYVLLQCDEFNSGYHPVKTTDGQMSQLPFWIKIYMSGPSQQGGQHVAPTEFVWPTCRQISRLTFRLMDGSGVVFPPDSYAVQATIKFSSKKD